MSADAARRKALRFAIYINLLGGDPAPLNHVGYGTYEFVLQEQFARLAQKLGHRAATEARKKGEALIVRQGILATVLELFGTEQPELSLSEPPSSSTEHGYHSDPGDAGSRNSCRRKFRHPDFLSALKHATHLSDPNLNIYPCDSCGGLHVGHSSKSDDTRPTYKIRRRLADIADALRDINLQRVRILREQKQLFRELEAQKPLTPCEPSSNVGIHPRFEHDRNIPAIPTRIGGDRN